MSSSAGGIRAGKAYVELGTRNKALLDGLAAAQAKLAAFGAGVNKLGGSFSSSFKTGLATLTSIGKTASIVAAAFGAAGIASTKIFAETDRRLLTPEEAEQADKMKEGFEGLKQSALQLNAAFQTALGPAFEMIVDSLRLGMNALRDWLRSNRELVQSTVSFLGSIRDALSGGDIKLAGEILWQGLKVAWLKGIAEISKPWNDWKTSFQQGASDAFFGVLELANQFWASLQETFSGIKAYVKTVFMEMGLEGAKWLIDLDRMLGKVSPEEAERQKRFLGTAQRVAGDRFALDAKTERQTIRAERDKRSEFLGAAGAASKEAIAKKNEDAVEQAKRELEAAKQELENLKRRAKEIAQPIPGPIDLSKEKLLREPGITIAGTFNAAAAPMLGGGAKNGEKLQAEGNAKLDKMITLLRDIKNDRGLVFA